MTFVVRGEKDPVLLAEDYTLAGHSAIVRIVRLAELPAPPASPPAPGTRHVWRTGILKPLNQ
jgi:hypothetical protein